MKKIIALLLVLIISLSLVSCEDKSPAEQQYQEIKRYLDDPNSFKDSDGAPFLSIRTVFDYESGVSLTSDEALNFSYKWLNEHKDYKDCADYLQNFVLVEDTLTTIKIQTTDVFGQVSETVSETYYYDNKGNCFQFSDLYKTLEFVNVCISTQDYIKDCKYDDNCKLISADLYQRNNIGALGTKITFVYDERGNLTEAAFVHYDGTSWSNTFAYNESNQLMTARYTKHLCLHSNTIHMPSSYKLFQYEYNEQGQLSKTMMETSADGGHLHFYNEYIYGEDGQIQEIQYSDYKEVYTYDENGRIAYIETIPSDTGTSQSYKLIYHYEDLLRYNK